VDVLAKARHILWVSIRSQAGPFKGFVFLTQNVEAVPKEELELSAITYCPCPSIHLYTFVLYVEQLRQAHAQFEPPRQDRHRRLGYQAEKQKET